MNKIVAGLAAALSLGLLATAAEAAPLGAAGSASGAAAPSDLIQVHGLHSSCKLDKKGWHRSHVWGRQACKPPRHDRHDRHDHHGKKHEKKHGKKKH